MFMLIRDKDKPMLAKVLVLLSFGCAVLSVVGALGIDLYLASTQWLLVAAVLAVWGVYMLLEAEFRI